VGGDGAQCSEQSAVNCLGIVQKEPLPLPGCAWCLQHHHGGEGCSTGQVSKLDLGPIFGFLPSLWGMFRACWCGVTEAEEHAFNVIIITQRFYKLKGIFYRSFLTFLTCQTYGKMTSCQGPLAEIVRQVSSVSACAEKKALAQM